MSSDNDSDSCDLFTKFSTKIKDSEDNFWSKYSVKNKDESLTENELEQNLGPKETENLSKSKIIDEPIIPVLNEEIVTPITRTDSPEKVITRINALLDNMKEKVTDALSQPVRGRGRKRKKKTPTRKSNRINKILPIAEPITLSDEDNNDNNEIKDNQKIDLNPIVYIKVLWRNFESEIFKLKKFQRLTPVKEYFIKMKNANPDLIFFTLDDKEINLDENCWASLRLNSDKIIEGSLLPDSYLNQPKQEIIDQTEYDFQFKVQTGFQRGKSFQVKCKKDDNIEIILWQVIRETGKDINDIKLSFDGVLLKPDQELSELDVMDGDCFDLI